MRKVKIKGKFVKCLAKLSQSIALILGRFSKQNTHLGFDVLTAVVMKTTIFWDITPCSPLGVGRLFGGTY
jgi:hypothetical protein